MLNASSCSQTTAVARTMQSWHWKNGPAPILCCAGWKCAWVTWWSKNLNWEITEKMLSWARISDVLAVCIARHCIKSKNICNPKGNGLLANKKLHIICVPLRVWPRHIPQWHIVIHLIQLHKLCESKDTSYIVCSATTSHLMTILFWDRHISPIPNHPAVVGWKCEHGFNSHCMVLCKACWENKCPELKCNTRFCN